MSGTQTMFRVSFATSQWLKLTRLGPMAFPIAATRTESSEHSTRHATLRRPGKARTPRLLGPNVPPSVSLIAAGRVM
jgi:hypothetical protein